VKIARAWATLHRVPVDVPLLSTRPVSVLLVQVESDSGLRGYGVASPTHYGAVLDFVNRELAPFVVGSDPLLAEQIWSAAEQRFNARGLSGTISSGLSGLDLALWDLRGKLLGQPVWQLLGGYSASVATYVTFGLPEYDADQLAAAARLAVDGGYRQLKMVVGRPAGVAEDVARLRRVRDAVGDDVSLMIDANEALDLVQATHLARRVEDMDVAWFEEPLRGNDVRQLAELRRRTLIPVAAGQFEGHRFRLRDLMLGGAVDIVQTNVLFVGGYTEGLKVAHVAEALRLPIANGGGWPDHNAHLMAAISNNHGVEMHAWQWTLAETLFERAPRPVNGTLTLTTAPGLGLDPKEGVLRDTEVKPA
jgi:L-alanine-DL-glutamate epimerase-like enolase superfamily enzyme